MITIELLEEQVANFFKMAQGLKPEMAQNFMLQAVGAVQFATWVAYQSKDAELAAKILDLWNSSWSKKFEKLLK